MVDLYLFCDESGTMPSKDSDGPFCVATVSSTNSIPAVSRGAGHIQDLAAVFTERACVPFVVFVRPRAGYEEKVDLKYSKINTMARATRLTTGRHEYLPKNGHNIRNLIWIRCMAISLMNDVLRQEEPAAIRNIQIILDRKTMPKVSRRLFEDRVRSLAEDINGPGLGADLSSRSAVDRRRHVHFGRKDISILWSDESAAREFGDGLFLAHRLSSLAKVALEGALEAELAQSLSIPITALFYDATEDVIRPLPRTVVNRWKVNTGLPEPYE
jgi:hypothetical protein